MSAEPIGDLSRYLHLTVEAGTGGRFDDCRGLRRPGSTTGRSRASRRATPARTPGSRSPTRPGTHRSRSGSRSRPSTCPTPSRAAPAPSSRGTAPVRARAGRHAGHPGTAQPVATAADAARWRHRGAARDGTTPAVVTSAEPRRPPSSARPRSRLARPPRPPPATPAARAPPPRRSPRPAGSARAPGPQRRAGRDGSRAAARLPAATRRAAGARRAACGALATSPTATAAGQVPRARAAGGDRRPRPAPSGSRPTSPIEQTLRRVVELAAPAADLPGGAASCCSWPPRRRVPRPAPRPAATRVGLVAGGLGEREAEHQAGRGAAQRRRARAPPRWRAGARGGPRRSGHAQQVALGLLARAGGRAARGPPRRRAARARRRCRRARAPRRRPRSRRPSRRPHRGRRPAAAPRARAGARAASRTAPMDTSAAIS